MATPDEAAMERVNRLLAHAWMVRTFLKHEEVAQDDEDMAETHRAIFDYARALEPSYQRRDVSEYLRRARGKLAKLRQAVERYEANYLRVSDHTNFRMAAQSLRAIYDDLAATLTPPGDSSVPHRLTADTESADPRSGEA